MNGFAKGFSRTCVRNSVAGSFDRTRVNLFGVVTLDVVRALSFLSEGFPALQAEVGQLSRVDPAMTQHISLLQKPSPAEITL